MISLSIIIPVYQVEQYIEECLSSVIKIQNLVFEIIIVDDGTKDHSIEIIERIIQEKKIYNIKIVRQDNKGLSEARNTGLKYAKGNYIWFIDSDDIIIPEGVENLIAKSNQEDILIGNYYRLHNGTKEINKHTLPSLQKISGFTAFQKYYLKNINTIVWRCIYKKEFLIKNNFHFLRGVTYEDVEWSPRVLFCAQTVLYSNIPIYIYRIRDNSIINSHFSIKKIDDILRVSDSLDNFKHTYQLNSIQASIIDQSTSYFLLLAYRKAKTSNIFFDEDKLISKIKNKKYKGLKYSILLLLRSLSPTTFDKILSLKFDKL